MAAFTIKGIYPDAMFNVDGMEQWIKDSVDFVAEDADKLFTQTHSSWSSKSTPRIIDDERMGSREYTRTIAREGLIYHIVTKGRDPKKSWVRYGSIPEKSIPATKPGSLRSAKRGEVGPYRKVSEDNAEQHPGIRAREFDEEIYKISKVKVRIITFFVPPDRYIWK